jgi:aspartate kinase
VDGVYSADPSMVTEARHLPEISYPVMQEMSMAGAKVLHAHAVQFAKEKNIAIYARSTFEPGRETLIYRLSPGTIIGVQAVVSEKHVERIRLHGVDVPALFRQTVEYLESEQVQIKEVNVTGIAAKGEPSKASFVVSVQNIFGWEQIKATLQNKIDRGIDFDTNLAALSLIGEGLNRNNLILMEAFDLLTCQGIPVYGVTTTSFRISFLVPRNHIEKSVQLCHTHWVADSII